MLFKKLFAATRSETEDVGPRPIFPLEVEARLNEVHARTPLRRHLDILYGGLRLGEQRYTDLHFRCLEETGTAVTPFNVYQRFQTRHDLLRYFLATLDVPGGRVECGAYRGATALLLCHAWQSRVAGFVGDGLYLIDSFSGTRASSAADFITVRDKHGAARMEPFFPAGKTDVRLENVKGHFREFPKIQIIDGWIPEVFEQLPRAPWAFVHLDVTLHEPTLAALSFFYDGLSEGGVILCDGSIFCPGVDTAVETFSRSSGAPYALLGHRQYVIMKSSDARGALPRS